MDSENAQLILWSYGLAAVLYTAFPLGLISRGYLRPPREKLRPLLLIPLLVLVPRRGLLVVPLRQVVSPRRGLRRPNEIIRRRFCLRLIPRRAINGA